MSIDVSKLSPEELYRLKESLSGIAVFGPWTKLREDMFQRPEPGRQPSDNRVYVWLCSGGGVCARGWYYRVGGGVVGILGHSGTVAHQSAEACMAAVDATLAGLPDVYLVGGE